MSIVSIQLYDSRQQAVRELVPITPGKVSIYVCGPTVQSAPHIGHLRSALVYDLLRRWLTYRGLDVTLVRNVTDVDDKILEKSAASGETWWALAFRVEREFDTAYAALNALPPTYSPRATGSIAQMQDLIAKLVERGHAYPAADGSGDVYFDTASWPAYGTLTHQRLDDMEDADDADSRGKRDPHDFALWKGHKPGEPESAAWPSPWGPGRPGWHIECSAMSTQYLGAQFDIHGGGRDLRFPHHENELAQSEAAGYAFAKLWMHNGLVSINDQKMSKSLGNSVFASELLRSAPTTAVRYFLSSAHYRSALEYNENSLHEATSAWERITGFVERATRRLTGTRYVPDLGDAHTVPAAFADAMDDDLNVPKALAVLHETIRAGNQALDDERLSAAADRFVEVTAMVEVLGLEDTTATQDGALATALDALIQQRATARQAARSAKDFATADAIRDELSAAGITLQDTPHGVVWSLDGEAI